MFRGHWPQVEKKRNAKADIFFPPCPCPCCPAKGAETQVELNDSEKDGVSHRKDIEPGGTKRNRGKAGGTEERPGNSNFEPAIRRWKHNAFGTPCGGGRTLFLASGRDSLWEKCITRNQMFFGCS